MKTLIAVLVMSLAASAQDKPPQDGNPPRPREGERPRPPRDGDQPRPRDGDPRPPGAPRDGDRPGQPPREPNRRPVPPFNPDEVRAWLKDNEPETMRRLNQFQEEGRREDVQRMLGDASMRMREMAELKQRDPKGYERLQEMRKLEREGGELAEAARKAPPEEKEAVSKKLNENLAKQFDMREEMRVREIAELKRRVDALEKALGDRKANKEKIVDRRRREMLGEKVDEDW